MAIRRTNTAKGQLKPNESYFPPRQKAEGIIIYTSSNETLN